MNYGYMIYSITKGGYYDRLSECFRGIAFASCYRTNEDAEQDIANLPKGWYRVYKILINK